MAALAPVPASTLPAAVQRIAAAMDGFSVEATRPSAADIAALAAELPRRARVYLSAVPNRPADELMAAAIAVRAAGFEPVPHVAVRNFASAGALDDFLARLNGEAEVQRVLVIAGDRAEHGPFRSAREAIDSGVLRRRGIRTIGIAGYPEGHPRIGIDELDRAGISVGGAFRQRFSQDHFHLGREGGIEALGRDGILADDAIEQRR